MPPVDHILMLTNPIFNTLSIIIIIVLWLLSIICVLFVYLLVTVFYSLCWWCNPELSFLISPYCYIRLLFFIFVYFSATLELQESVSQPIILSFISPPFFFIVTIGCKAHNNNNNKDWPLVSQPPQLFSFLTQQLELVFLTNWISVPSAPCQSDRQDI